MMIMMIHKSHVRPQPIGKARLSKLGLNRTLAFVLTGGCPSQVLGKRTYGANQCR